MYENHIYHIIAWLITTTIISCVVVLGAWLINMRHFNDFKDEATTIVQRSGGLTQDAQYDIQQISDKRYRDQFTVTTKDDKPYTETQVSTGREIQYTIHARLRVFSFSLPETTRTISTTSIIRADSQPYR